MKGGFTNVYGLDMSQACLDLQAETQIAMGFEVTPGQLISDLRDAELGTFSAVCMGSALHHIADLGSQFAEVSKLLRPGGGFIVSAEPTNMKRYNAFCGTDPKLDLIDLTRRMQSGSRERTNATRLVAEFHAGAGFSREDLTSQLQKCGLTIEHWDVHQWVSLVAINYARDHIGSDPKVTEEFMRHYANLIAFDQFIKGVAPQFAADNFFTFVMVARKSA